LPNPVIFYSFLVLFGLFVIFVILFVSNRRKIKSKDKVFDKNWTKEKINHEYAEDSKSKESDIDPLKFSQEKDLLKFEYSRAQRMVTHYDNLNWQIGSIIVGSNIVALGFVASSGSSNLLLVPSAALGGISSLFCWILWFYRHMAIYNVKNDRLTVIEVELGLAQHRMVRVANKKGWLGHERMSGHDVSVYLWIGLSVAWVVIVYLASL
jgi:hypothetical protein